MRPSRCEGEPPIRPEACLLHVEERIGGSDAVQGASYGWGVILGSVGSLLFHLSNYSYRNRYYRGRYHGGYSGGGGGFSDS